MDIHISFNDPLAFLIGLAWSVGSVLAGFYLARLWVYLDPPRSGDDRMGLAVGFFFFLLLAAIAFVVSFVLLFFAHAGIAALVGLGFVGLAFGLGSKS